MGSCEEIDCAHFINIASSRRLQTKVPAQNGASLSRSGSEQGPRAARRVTSDEGGPVAAKTARYKTNTVSERGPRAERACPPDEGGRCCKDCEVKD